jgi:hypothetical protein
VGGGRRQDMLLCCARERLPRARRGGLSPRSRVLCLWAGALEDYDGALRDRVPESLSPLRASGRRRRGFSCAREGGSAVALDGSCSTPARTNIRPLGDLPHTVWIPIGPRLEACKRRARVLSTIDDDFSCRIGQPCRLMLSDILTYLEGRYGRDH